jgi:hypothetical protein
MAKPNKDKKNTMLSLEPDVAPITAAPKIGPVQENDTKTVVKAIKKEPA